MTLDDYEYEMSVVCKLFSIYRLQFVSFGCARSTFDLQLKMVATFMNEKKSWLVQKVEHWTVITFVWTKWNSNYKTFDLGLSHGNKPYSLNEKCVAECNGNTVQGIRFIYCIMNANENGCSKELLHVCSNNWSHNKSVYFSYNFVVYLKYKIPVHWI